MPVFPRNHTETKGSITLDQSVFGTTSASPVPVTMNGGVDPFGVTLPSAGTYLIGYSGRLDVTTSASPVVKLRNTTDSADVAGTSRESTNATGTYFAEQLACTALLTIAASKAIQLYLSTDAGTAYVVSTANSKFVIWYIKISD